MKREEQRRLISRFRPGELEPNGQAQRLDRDTITIQTSAFIQIGLILMALVVAISIASYTFGTYASSFWGVSSPHPERPPEPPVLAESGAPVEQDLHEAFRQKADRLQLQLAELRSRQTKLETQLQSKTMESNQYALEASRLRRELVVKERELEDLSKASKRTAVAGRRFSRGSTEYKPTPGTASESRGFALDDGTEVVLATASPEYPVEIFIELAPLHADPGEPYQLSVSVHNRGNRSIYLTGLEIVWNVAGRFTGGAIPIAAKNVSPRSTLLLHEVDGTWVEDLSSAQVMVTVTLAEGGRLSNTLSWTDS